MSHWTFKRPANKKKCIFSDFHSWLNSKAKPSGFKYIRQNITAFDLKTFLLLRLAGGWKKHGWQSLFSFMILSLWAQTMVWGDYGEQRLQGRDEVQCHLKTQRRQKIGIHDAFAFSFRAFFFLVRNALLGIKRMLMAQAKALNYFCMK